MRRKSGQRRGPGPVRLSGAALADHLQLEEPATRRVVLVLRRTVLRTAPAASEAVKFGALCYFHGDAYFKAIGGNICMIELKRGKVVLSFIRGSQIEDREGLLQGKGKLKRFVPIGSEAEAVSPAVAGLIKRAAQVETWG